MVALRRLTDDAAIVMYCYFQLFFDNDDLNFIKNSATIMIFGFIMYVFLTFSLIQQHDKYRSRPRHVLLIRIYFKGKGINVFVSGTNRI